MVVSVGAEQRRDRKMGFVLGVYEGGVPGEGGGRRQGGGRSRRRGKHTALCPP